MIGLMKILNNEARKRHFNGSTIMKAIGKLINPIQYLFLIIQLFQWIIIFVCVKIPIFVLRELRAIQSHDKHHYPNTLTSWFSSYLPLIIDSIIELITIFVIAIGAWRSVYHLLFTKHTHCHKLQMGSSCGRKVVAWSDNVKLELIENISSVTGASHAEILLAATVDSLKVYFRQTGQEIPWQVLTWANYISQKSLYVKHDKLHKQGLLCLPLPTKTPLFDDDFVEILQVLFNYIKILNLFTGLLNNH